MRHEFPRTFTPAAPLPAPALLPLSPAGYLRTRRQASGQSIATVARRLGDAHRADGEVTTALLVSLERDGTVAKHRETLDAIRSVVPFDPDVYHQLATEPAALHPAICRTCGTSAWDSDNACPDCRSGADR